MILEEPDAFSLKYLSPIVIHGDKNSREKMVAFLQLRYYQGLILQLSQWPMAALLITLKCVSFNHILVIVI